MKNFILTVMILLVSLLGVISMFTYMENPFSKELDIQHIRTTLSTMDKDLEILKCDMNCAEFDFGKREASKESSVLIGIFQNLNWKETYKDVLVYGDDLVIESVPARTGLISDGQYLLLILSSCDSNTYSDYFANEKVVYRYNDSTFVCYQTFNR